MKRPDRRRAVKWAIVVTMCLVAAYAGAKVYDGVPSTCCRFPDPMYGDTPPQHATAWLRFAIMGPRNSPPPTIFVSPTKFPIHQLNKLIVLSARDYAAIRDFSDAAPCPATGEVRDVYAAKGSIEFAEHTKRGTRILCVMRRADACKHLIRLLDQQPTALRSEDAGPLAWLRDWDCGDGSAVMPSHH